MRISFRHKYVMFDVPKSASTSINFALRHVSECILDGNGSVKHMNVADYEEYFEPFLEKSGRLDTNTLERIAVVREPFDMLASYYKYLRRSGTENVGHHDYFRNTCDISFSDFLEGLCGGETGKYMVACPSIFVLNSVGKVGIDLLFSFERLDDLAKHLSSKVGQDVKIPKKNVSTQQDVGPVGQVLQDRVRRLFENDFILYETIMRRPTGEPLRIRHNGIAELRQ